MLNEDGRDIIISSCCHSINLLIQKYFPAELPFLANVLSPMQAHCLEIKEKHPGAKTVFIGPCVAKKDEAAYYEGFVDAVLTFDELTAWLKEAKIDLEAISSEVAPEGGDDGRARFFPTTGGILKTMAQNNPNYTYMAMDGVENCIAALREIENRKHSQVLYRDVGVRRKLCRRSRHGEVSSFSHKGLQGGVGLCRQTRF